MSPLPHFFGFDFTGAGPWLLAGGIIGLMLGWGLRALRAKRARLEAQARYDDLLLLNETARQDHQGEVAGLLSDVRNLEQALADAERRATEGAEAVTRLTGVNDRLSRAELASRNDLLAADSQLAKVKSSLQWAETQAQTAAQDKQALEQRLHAFGDERQNFNAQIATARTAAELKDSEIARLINQVQWHENRTVELEREKQSMHSGLLAQGGKETEISDMRAELARVKAERDNANASIANLQSKTARDADAASSVQLRLDQASNELSHFRYLAETQASELQELRAAAGAAAAATVSATGGFPAANGGPAPAAASSPGAAAPRAYVARFRRPMANGASAELQANGAGKSGLHSYRPDAGLAKKIAPVKAYKFGKPNPLVQSGQPQRTPLGLFAKTSAATGKVLITKRVEGGVDVQSLQAKVAQLTEDAEKYRRLSEAVLKVNQIASETF